MQLYINKDIIIFLLFSYIEMTSGGEKL